MNLQNRSDSNENWNETAIVKMLKIFLLTTYLLCLMDVKRLPSFLWEPTVLIFSPLCYLLRRKSDFMQEHFTKGEKTTGRSPLQNR